MNSNSSRPSMFSCATQVSLIQVGNDDFELKSKGNLQFLHQGIQNLAKSKESKQQLSKPVLKRVSEGFSFTDEVRVFIHMNGIQLKYSTIDLFQRVIL